MLPSEDCYSLIRLSEGLRLVQYSDPAPAGHPTIGYGHRILPGEDFSLGIGEPTAEWLLISDAGKACVAVESLVTVSLTQGQIDALTDFVFNLGKRSLARSTLLRLTNAGRFDDAAEEFKRWVYAGSVKLPGLVFRRQRERELFLS